MKRVLVCENDPVLRSALADLVDAHPTLELLAATSDPSEIPAAIADQAPDCALLDVRMPHGGGPAAARLLRARDPATRIVAFSAHADRDMVVEMLLAGAAEYLVKGADTARVIEALERTGHGHLSLPLVQLEELVFDLVDRVHATEAGTAAAV